MIVGQISYTNTKPFFYGWPADQISVVTGTPRELSHMARNNKLTAAPLPVVECWRLEKEFEPLENWGIAVEKASHSVFLLSKKPMSELKDVTIGVTTESYTSVALCQILFFEKYGNSVTFKRGFGEDDAAWLVIGDQALQYWGQPSWGRWTFLTDLATEWWSWKNLPFVFAQWVVKKDIPAGEKAQLISCLRNSLAEGKKAFPAIAAHQEKYVKISAAKIQQYLAGFTYELGEKEKEAERIFRSLVDANEGLLSPLR